MGERGRHYAILPSIPWASSEADPRVRAKVLFLLAHIYVLIAPWEWNPWSGQANLLIRDYSNFNFGKMSSIAQKEKTDEIGLLERDR